MQIQFRIRNWKRKTKANNKKEKLETEQPSNLKAFLSLSFSFAIHKNYNYLKENTSSVEQLFLMSRKSSLKIG